MCTSEITQDYLAGCVFYGQIFEIRKTSLGSQSLASQVTASSPGRFDRKVGCDRKKLL